MKNFAMRSMLLLSTVCLWTSAQAQHGVQPGECPNTEPMENFFGYFVQVIASSIVTGTGDAKKKDELTCWVAGASKSDQQRLPSDGKGTEITSEYSYTIAPSGISASVRVYGSVGGKDSPQGSAVATLWLMWHDSLRLHSKQIPVINSEDFYQGRPPTDADLANSLIKVKIKLLQNPPQCSGEDSGFSYKTGVYGIGETVRLGSIGGILPPGKFPGGPINDWYIRADKCGIPSGSATFDAMNGLETAIHITVNEEAFGVVDHDKSHPSSLEGHLKVELSGIRLCVVRPAKPTDLTLTSASGANYWCP
jgi:hypothetical protein